MSHFFSSVSDSGFKHTVNLQRVPGLKKHYELLRLLEKEGFLIIKGQNKDVSCEIMPYQDRAWKIIPVSKPSRKVNLNYHHITQLYKFGLGVSIFYTSKGYLTDKECIKHRIGGEYIYKIF